MSSWRDIILKEFVPKVTKLTLVSDPDCLLSEEKLATELRGRGFEIIEFNDSIEFRYAYESKYRSIWDKGEHTDLVVVLRLQTTEFFELPYDILQAGRQLSFNLGDLFPNMSYPVIEQLDKSLLDLLFRAQNKAANEPLGDNLTKDFILKHVFDLDAKQITNDVKLLNFLLRLHYKNICLPTMLIERLVELLQAIGNFKSWALYEIVSDAESFFQFIQERWLIFLDSIKEPDQLKENHGGYGLKHQGPANLPFAHEDIRVYMDNLFVEGKLTPVDYHNLEIPDSSWVLSGIKTAKTNMSEHRVSRLFKIIDSYNLSMQSRHSDWIEFAMKWAELSALVYTTNNSEHIKRHNAISERLNLLFANWLENNYASLTNVPPTKPAMLHQLARHLARYIEGSNNTKVALLVIDGLSLDQWVTVRNNIQNANLSFCESAVFAWIPTLTSVSRQAIFSGKPPIYFPTSINTTNSEEKLWKQFWQNHNIPKAHIAYKRGLGDGNPKAAMEELINPNHTKVVGLVIDKVDKIMHGMQLGAAGMHSQITQWCQANYLNALLNYLLENDYKVWITSDHGNIEATGKGRPTEGSIAESRGERARIYPTFELRSQVYANFSFAREWQPIGLPESYFPLVATSKDAFIKPNDSIVGHGGIAIEEVIVPLIKVAKKV